MSGDQRRKYQTSVERGEAAAAILAAGRHLFAAKGYTATSMVDIATAAGVARPTLFAAVGPKPVIFRAVLEAAVSGGRAGVPIRDQPWLREAIAEPDARQMLLLHARNIRRIGERIAPLYWAAECAAESDESVRGVFGLVEEDRLFVGRAIAAALVLKSPLRADYDESSVADVLNALISPASWRALVWKAGWAPDRFESWAGASACQLLLPDR